MCGGGAGVQCVEVVLVLVCRGGAGVQCVEVVLVCSV